MTRSAGSSTYDDDFFAWTRDQAAALRRVPKEALGDGVDIEHVAEEIEDLGERDLREVTSFIELLFEHLIKIDACPNSSSIAHWRSEARNFRRSALRAFTPGMRQLIDVAEPWREAWTALKEDLFDSGIVLPGESVCPFELNDLLSADFDLDRALKKVATESSDAPRRSPASK